MKGKEIYIPDGFSQAALENLLSEYTYILNVAPRANGCDKTLTAFACANVFHPCHSSPGVYFDQTAKSLCTQYTTQCQFIIETVKSLPITVPKWVTPDCDSDCVAFVDQNSDICNPGEDSANPLPVYSDEPLDSASSTYPGLLMTVPNYYSAASTPLVPASLVTYIPGPPCPAPLVNPTDTSLPTLLDGACRLPCPFVMWTHSEYVESDTFADVIGTISLVLSLFLVVTWIVFPQQRQKRYILYFISNLFVMGFVLWIGLRMRGSQTVTETQCETNSSEYHMKGFCLFQSMIMVFCNLAAIGWWMVQAVDLFLKVYLNKKYPKGSPEENRKEIAFHAFCWGLPAICLIGALASEQLGGYAIGANWCLFSQGRDTTGTWDLSYAFFFYPIFAMATVGTVCMLLTASQLCEMNRQADRRATVTSRTGAPNRFKLGSFMRLMLFIVALAIVWVFLLSYKLHTYINSNKWTDSTVDFIQCLLVTQYVDPSTECGSHPTDRMDFSMLMGLIFVTFIPGTLVFLLHGTSLDIYRAWAGLLFDKCGVKMCAKYSGRRVEIYELSKTQTASRHGTTASVVSEAPVDTKSKRNLFAKSPAAGWRAPPGATPSTPTHTSINTSASATAEPMSPRTPSSASSIPLTNLATTSSVSDTTAPEQVTVVLDDTPAPVASPRANRVFSQPAAALASPAAAATAPAAASAAQPAQPGQPIKFRARPNSQAFKARPSAAGKRTYSNAGTPTNGSPVVGAAPSPAARPAARPSAPLPPRPSAPLPAPPAANNDLPPPPPTED